MACAAAVLVVSLPPVRITQKLAATSSSLRRLPSISAWTSEREKVGRGFAAALAGQPDRVVDHGPHRLDRPLERVFGVEVDPDVGKAHELGTVRLRNAEHVADDLDGKGATRSL